MALLNQTFNATDLPQGSDGDFQPLPAGWYSVTVNDAEIRTTKAGNGQYIAVRYDVTGPTHEGRVVFGNINISNPNPKAEEIGHQQLGQLMRAIGLTQVSDTDQLIGGSLEIKLKVTKSEQYGDGNDVSGFKAISGSSAPMQQPSAPASQSAPTQRPPWQK